MSMTLSGGLQSENKEPVATMKALVFRGPNQIGIEQVPIPKAGPGEAVIRVTLTTICGTDIHIVKGEYAVRPGLTIGHEPVGVIHEIGVGVTGYRVGERVLVGAITPCGQCNYCLMGEWSQCGGLIGGWKFGNTINGAQAEYLLVPSAQANLAKIPDDLSDEQVVLLSDIASTGISAAESGHVQIGDSVAVFAQGPIGLCATAGAKLRGASLIIAVESDPARQVVARRMGADVVLDHTKIDAVAEIRRLTHGVGVDVSIEALGTQATFESALRALRAGGTLSSLGVYAGKLSVPLEPFAAGLGDHKIVTTLCPGGKERMRRLMELVRHGRLDLVPLLTHTFSLDKIVEAYKIFSERREGVIKVAIKPWCIPVRVGGSGMRILKAGALYFAMVFGVGFVLGPIRMLLVVPQLGERAAELLEAPIMLVVIVLAARWVVRKLGVAALVASRLAMGCIALGMMLIAEFTLVLWVRGLTLSQYFAGRDPVAATAYYVMLGVFGIMPALTLIDGRI